jgi:hypothetical protein
MSAQLQTVKENAIPVDAVHPRQGLINFLPSLACENSQRKPNN